MKGNIGQLKHQPVTVVGANHIGAGQSGKQHHNTYDTDIQKRFGGLAPGLPEFFARLRTAFPWGDLFRFHT